MARDEFREARFGFAQLPMVPPFSFSGMTTRLFPLRASFNALQSFCDGYLNIIPPALGRFKVAAPYVFLMMIDYGRMSSRAVNLGWIAQREVAFAVPLEWYRVLDGQWVFHDWAWSMPFIFVDEDQSQALGRTVYGWPKVLVHLDSEPNMWLHRPRGQVPVMSLSTDVFAKLYAGASQEHQVFLKVVRDASSPFAQFPPDLRASPSPWMVMPNAAQNFADGLWDLWRLASGLSDAPPGAEDRANNLGLMLRAAMSMVAPVGPDLHYNTINLKQFRSANDPARYCYQAVTNARMVTRAFNGAGPLGELSVLGGDLSGGYSVHLKCWPSLPIVDVLGLEVHRWWRDGDVDVASLKPVFPFWYNADLDYNSGYNLAWRSYDGVWRDEWGRSHKPAERLRVADKLYNTTLGPSASPAAGEFIFNGLTLRVMPLLAHKDRVKEFIREYLNEPLKGNDGGYEFDLWAGDDDSPQTFVYLAVSTCKERLPKTNDVGSWSESEMSFFIPVVLRGTDKRGAPFEALGLAPAFTFNSNPMSVIISTEVSGIPSIVGEFNVAAQKWMDDCGPSPTAAESFVHVRSNQIPVFGEGQEATLRAVVEVGRDHARASGKGADPLPAQRPLEFIEPDVFREARSCAFALLAQSDRFKVFTIKQVRDIARPDKACFQSLVCVYRAFRSVYTIDRIDVPIYARVHDYPAVPIVDRLGLVYRSAERSNGTNAYVLEAHDPFWLSTTGLELQSDVLCYRAGDGEWMRGPDEGHFIRTLAGRKVTSPAVPESDAISFDMGAASPPDIRMEAPLEHEDEATREDEGFEALRRIWAAESTVKLVNESLRDFSMRPAPGALHDADAPVSFEPGAEDTRVTLAPESPGVSAAVFERVKEIPPSAILRALLDLRLPDREALKRWTEAKTALQTKIKSFGPDPARVAKFLREEVVPALRARGDEDAREALAACDAVERFVEAVRAAAPPLPGGSLVPPRPPIDPLKVLAVAPKIPRLRWIQEQLKSLAPPAEGPVAFVRRASEGPPPEVREMLDANFRHVLDDLVDAVARVWKPAEPARRPS